MAIALAYGLATGLSWPRPATSQAVRTTRRSPLGCSIGKRISPVKTVGYIIAQLVGATVAALLLKGVFPSSMWAAQNIISAFRL